LEREAQRLEKSAKQGKQVKKPQSIFGDISRLEKAV
jgi:hypothetical protein